MYVCGRGMCVCVGGGGVGGARGEALHLAMKNAFGNPID